MVKSFEIELTIGSEGNFPPKLHNIIEGVFMSDFNISKFKDIPNFPGYRISENGEVYSDKRNKIISQAKNWAGYAVVTITDELGFRSPRKVHRLVYSTYVGGLESGKVIDHKDNDKSNNHYSNLQQITPSQNSIKSFISGKNISKIVWTKDMIHKICKMIEKNYSNKKIFKNLRIDYNSNRYNCNHLIGDLIRGTIHKDITSEYNLSEYNHAVNQKDVKLTEENVRNIYISLLYDNTSAAKLAKQYHVTHSTICKIRDKKTWRTITNNVDNNWEIITFNDYPTGLKCQ
jgi:hypothetical protein